MWKLFGIGIICLFSGASGLIAQEAYPSHFKIAQPPGTIGEKGNLFLIDEGFYARPIYNDIFGGTDKYLSGELQLGWMFVGDDQSLSLDFSWRFLTPHNEPSPDAEVSAPRSGRFADWLGIEASYAKVLGKVFSQTMRVQYTLGISHIGEHGARDVHRSIHQYTGSSLDGLEYSNQPEGSDFSRGLELALHGEGDLIYSIGGHANKFMREGYLKLNHVLRAKDALQWGSEAKLVRQFTSEAYVDPREWRYELSTGFRWSWYRPSIKYLSPFLKSDKVSQIYLDPLALYFEY